MVEAFYDGYQALRSSSWEFIVKLDGDLSLPPTYFEKCFKHFELDPKLGIGGGDIYHELGGVQKLKATPKFHVRGATKNTIEEPVGRRSMDCGEPQVGTRSMK